MTPIKFYQIFHIEARTGNISRINPSEWDGGTGSFFTSESDAEKFIFEHFKDENSDDPDYKLVILPVYCVKSKV